MYVHSTRVTEMYIFYRDVHILQRGTRITDMYIYYNCVHTLQRSAHITEVYYITEMYIYYRDVHILQRCICITEMYILLRPSYITGMYLYYRGVDVTAITSSLIGGSKHAGACQAVAAMMSKGCINPADATTLYTAYTSPDPPPVEMIRNPTFLSMCAVLFSILYVESPFKCVSKLMTM